MLQSEFYNHLHNIEMSCHYRPKQYRYGQMLYNASFNEFSKYDPAWFKPSNIENIDPFYNDNNISAFKDELIKHFSKYINYNTK